MLAATTLAYLLKQAGLRCHITVGGRTSRCCATSFLGFLALRSVRLRVLFAGEMPLLRLVETLDGPGDLTQVPDLVWRDGGQVRVNGRRFQPPSDIGRNPLKRVLRMENSCCLILTASRSIVTWRLIWCCLSSPRTAVITAVAPSAAWATGRAKDSMPCR